MNTPVARSFAWSLLIYTAFSALVFVVMGMTPQLGFDHISYMRVAEEIMGKRPNGDYFGEINSVRSFSVLLAYFYHFTGSHLLSMKIILAVTTVFWGLGSELYISQFAGSKKQAVLFSLLSMFSISFGVASWGATDYTALMPRTLVVPSFFLCLWFFLHFYESGWRYAVIPVFVLLSVIHLSAFYLLGTLFIFEIFDFLFLRGRRLDRRCWCFPAWSVVSFILLLQLQAVGWSIGATSYLLSMLPIGKNSFSFVTNVQTRESQQRTSAHDFSASLARLEEAEVKGDNKDSVAKPEAWKQFGTYTPRQAWEFELSTRAWRNMPLPLVNIANIFSSFALIFLLSLAGVWVARETGWRTLDGVMLGLSGSVVIMALGPQTMLWILRTFTDVRPFNIEEIRTFSFIMFPCLYFVHRLYTSPASIRRPVARFGSTAIVGSFLILPMSMRALTVPVRENLLKIMITTKMVDETNPSRISNARSALGLVQITPLYYTTRGIEGWLRVHAIPGSLILTDRDDILSLEFYYIGSQQEVLLQGFGDARAEAIKNVHLRLANAFQRQDLSAVLELARSVEADYVVIPWCPEVPTLYTDKNFSLIATIPARSKK